MKSVSELTGLSESKVKQFLREGLISPTTMRDYEIGQYIKKEKGKGRVEKDILLDVSTDSRWGVSYSTAYNIAKRLG